jgi:signal transduction histidine kinase
MAATRRPARLTGDQLSADPVGVIVRGLGMRAAVAMPIVVQGCQWGMAVAATSRERFPAGAEARAAEFVELAATAITNVRARQELRELAGTHASLRRLAMLVAKGEPPETVFAAVTGEVQRYFGGGTARMIRYELDGTATLLTNEGATEPPRQRRRTIGELRAAGLAATVLRTGRAARVDDYGEVTDGELYLSAGLRFAVATPIYVHGRLWGAIAVGSEEPMPHDAEHRMTDFTDLVATAVANAQSRDELMATRARIVAASDDARRRIERDLHDGAQQRLIGLAIRLRSAAETPAGPDQVRHQLNEAAGEILEAIDELREISRGIHPAILSSAGLSPALRALGRRSPVPAEMDLRIAGRLPEPVEVAAYYVVAEALTNAAKHARASVVQVHAEVSGGALRIQARDDGTGGADPGRGSGLAGLKDRIEALGGTLAVHSPPGHGTTVCCTLPV